MNRQGAATFAVGVLVGVAGALLFDPRTGARRRALMRDKVGKYCRETGRWVTGRARATAGPVRGAVHGLARRAPGYEPAPPDMDAFIKQRVESVLGHATELPLKGLIFDAADGVVHVRGVVPDNDCAEAILQRVAEVKGVRAAISFMHTEDGTPAGAFAGDVEVIATMPAVLKTNKLRRHLIARWPSLTDDDILASEGHVDRLADAISRRSGETEVEVRAALDAMLLAVP